MPPAVGTLLMTLNTVRQSVARDDGLNEGAREVILAEIRAGEQLARQLIELPELLDTAAELINGEAENLRESHTVNDSWRITDDADTRAWMGWRQLTDIAARLEAAREQL